MARGAEAKLRRRNQRKGIGQQQEGDDDNDNNNNADDDNNDVIDMFATTTTTSDSNEPFPPFPTSKKSGNVISKNGGVVVKKSKVIVEDVYSDDDDDDDNNYRNKVDDNLPKKKKKSLSSKGKNGDMDIPTIKGNQNSGGMLGGIKTTPLILLILMVGTTLLPALIYVGDYASSLLSKTDISSYIGYQLGIGSVPKQRIISFYEKHSPEKISDVPSILSKHYGQYPTLIKKLERKYQDYGYFLGWEDDVTTYKMGIEYVQSLYDVWIQQYWNRYAPQTLKTAFRNVRYNITFLYKRINKVWKKHIWPKYLQPIFGVPDGINEQKKKDAKDAAMKKKQQQQMMSSSSRRKNTDYRDDENE